MVLEELGLPYETKFLDFQSVKQEPFISFNPNGRVPAIEDPNTGLKLFESGAIIEYLVEQYDKSNKLCYTEMKEKYLTKSWLHFQMSGQGPYFGQKAWFTMFHPEKIPSAIERYENEIKRVLGVIDAHLKKQGTEYLVGSKCTYADVAWVPWDAFVEKLMGESFDMKKDYPLTAAWHERVTSRPAIKKTLEAKAKAMSESK